MWTGNADTSSLHPVRDHLFQPGDSYTHASPVELSSVGSVSQNWRGIANYGNLWDFHHTSFWKMRVSVPKIIKQLEGVNSKLAYYLSVIDSKRSFLFREELSDNPWYFRFKASAGEDWTDQCPWNQGAPAAQVSFNSQTAELECFSNSQSSVAEMYSGVSLSWELCWWPVTRQKQTAYKHYARNIEHFCNIMIKNSCSTESLLISDYRERVLNICDGPSMRGFHSGNCMRLLVNDVLVPTYFVQRPPAGRGGFLLESCWAVYASWELPLRGVDESLEDGQLSMTTRRQWREIDRYNLNMLTRINDE